jgi:group I intron endonuclease
MGAVFAIFGGFYYWVPKIVGKKYNEFLGKVHFWSMFIGVRKTTQKWIYLLSSYILFSFLFNKSISLNDLIDKRLLDKPSNDIPEDHLENQLNNMPSPNSPNPNKGKNKLIFEKLNNIQSSERFINLKESRADILLKLKNKSGIYMFFNLVNANSYIGSSTHLDRRFRVHMSNVNSVNLPLYTSINKYGPNKFVFIILQYCVNSQEVCLGLEQYYLDFYKPKYNILKLAGSSQGFKHSPETIALLQKKHSKELHPRFGSKASEEQKNLTSLALKNHYALHGHHSKGKTQNLSAQYGIGGTNIIMKSEEGEIMSFPSINSARLHFRVRFSTISNNINSNLPILIKGMKWYITSGKNKD